MKIIDAHSHIDYITHKYQSDVVGTICCTTDESQWSKLIDIMNQDSNVYGAFGVHPWFVDSVKDEFEKRFEQLLKRDTRFMIGEIGIDKNKPNIDKQIDLFTIQLNLAVKLKRTIFLHCVGAWNKILHILKQYKQSELPVIVAHAFNGNEDILQKLLVYSNVFFSFNKIDVCSRNCCIEQIPKTRILIESDGKTKVILTQLIETITDIKSDETMSNVIYENTQRIINNG